MTEAATVLGPAWLDRAWAALGADTFDVLVVGGGIVGVGTALDAATRGLRVALVEARDFAAGTSSRSSKMFHGGLRYLEQFDFGLVAEALRERELSMSVLAPHLVKPLEFLFPLTRRVWERPYMAAGFVLYDLMGGAKSVPAQRHHTRSGARRVAPGLRDDVHVGGIRYWDTLVDDARHTLTVARTAARHGAVLRTSTQLVDFLREGARVTGARVRDTETGARREVRARVVVNATGVWTDELQALTGAAGEFTVRASKGVHIVVPRDRIDSSAALILRTEKSVLFVIPWDDHWIIGTTDTDWDLDLAHPTATRADIDYILGHLNSVLREPIDRADITGVYAGLRPLLAGRSDSTAALSRAHAVARVAPGLIAIAGGKYTTYRVMGVDTVDAVVDELGRADVPPSPTAETPLLGADGYRARCNRRDLLAERYGVRVGQVDRLLGRYGSLIDDVLAPTVDRPDLLAALPGADRYLAAEIVYAAAAEGARHLEDVLVRRTRIAMEYDHRGVACARVVADLMGDVLGWDDARRATEIALYERHVGAELAAQDTADEEIAHALLREVPAARPHLRYGEITARPMSEPAHETTSTP